MGGFSGGSGGGGGGGTTYITNPYTPPNPLVPVLPTFARQANYVLKSTDQALLPTMYWNWVIRVDDKISSPLAKYYMYYSTDHDTYTGGIALATANDPLGPWTFRQKVFLDTWSAGAANSQGQTETPSVIWDEELSLFVMYYQQIAAGYGAGNSIAATGVQSTLRCTSPDGITWTKDPNFIIDKQYNSQVPGDGHTGYFTPFQIDGQWSAYHLYGGTSIPHFAYTRLNTPGEAIIDPREMGIYSHMVPQPDGVPRFISWNTAFAFKSRGRLMGFARITDWSSGNAAANNVLGVFPLSQDLRKPIGRVRIVWQPVQTWETNDIRSVTPMFDNDGNLYIYYLCRAASGGTQYLGVLKHAL